MMIREEEDGGLVMARWLFFVGIIIIST